MAVKTKELLQVSNDLNKKISDKWITIPVKDFAEIINGGAFKSKFFNKTKGMRLVRIRDLTQNRLPTFYDGDYDKMYIVNSGDFLVGMDGDFIGVEWRNGKALLNQRVCKIITNDEIIHPKFFRLGINRYLQKIHSATSYLTVAHLSSNTINNIEFPFPSLSEQKRIVSKIESIFAQIDAAKEALDRAKILLKQSRQSVLKSAFEGKLVPQDPNDESIDVLLKRTHGDSKNIVFKNENFPKGWLNCKIDNICELIGGGTPSRKNLEYFSGNIVWLTPTQISKNKIKIINNSKEKITELGLKKSSAKLISKYSVLLTSRATIGYVAIAGTEVATNQGFASFVCSDAIFNYYLAYWLSSKKNLLESQATGTTFKEISKSKLRELQISLPPLLEQKRIVSKIESIFDRIDAVERYVESTLNRLGVLKKSTLKQAFEGKLVPQDSNDEPAEILLQKIKQERKQLIQKQKPSRKIKNVK